MKYTILSLCILLFTQLSCNESNRMDLNGSWKMISFRDDVANSIVTKPSKYTDEIVVEFIYSTKTKGNLVSNSPANIFKTDFQISRSKSLSIVEFISFRTADPNWSDIFFDNIAKAKSYSIEKDGSLNIVTSNNRILTFARI